MSDQLTRATRSTAIAPLEREAADRAVRLWLILVAGLVFAMVIVGGATRLTESGLSITQWLPLLGAIPPLSDADWLAAFENYKQIPQYTQLNSTMSLAEFKVIYWWEWSHRFLGRFIGIAFAIPLLAFWRLGKLRDGLGLKLLGVLALGGLQGFFGWYMVKSGLTDRVDVSHYRLALHLTTAFAILAAIVWLIFSLSPRPARATTMKTLATAHKNTAWLILALVFLQVVLGAFVAGTDAGLVSNTWPLMDGQVIPDGLLNDTPWYMNAFENVIAIQFNHRIIAYTLLAIALWHVFSLWRSSADDRIIGSSQIVALAIFAQAALGVFTLLSVPEADGIPIVLGLMHQGGGAIVTILAVWHLHTIRSAP